MMAASGETGGETGGKTLTRSSDERREYRITVSWFQIHVGGVGVDVGRCGGGGWGWSDPAAAASIADNIDESTVI